MALRNLYVISTMDVSSNPMDEVVPLGVSFDDFDKWYNLLLSVQFHCLVLVTKRSYELILSFLLLLGDHGVIFLRLELLIWLE